MQFDELNLIDPLLRAVRAQGYNEPTPIQAQAIPHVLGGQDLLGCAQTGTGKTAAFALPILQHLFAATPRKGRRPIRALVVSPTRELATQIGESFRSYGQHTPIKSAVIFGGVGQNPQVQALQRGVDILVATPGRLLDLMNQGHVRLNQVEILVLDEADRMLDMGFIHDIKRIVAAVPARRQTLLFSATMPKEARNLANNILTNPAYVEVTPPASTVELTEQAVYFVEKNDKHALLVHLLDDREVARVLVFTRTKHRADRLVKLLKRTAVQAEAIHSNKSQRARERALANFKSGRIRVLVATDIAARGIDVDQISHVVNYDLPNEPDSYVHRIGRTGRAGAAGAAVSFCGVDERDYLTKIERLIRMHIPVAKDHPFPSSEPLPAPGDLTSKGQARQSKNKNGSGRRSNNYSRPKTGRRRNSKHRQRNKSAARPGTPA